ncbi:MAG: D-Ala-D-Ala carboxypeptidase family metallohydrolase [Nanoarchaeota archaeon]
MTNPITRRDFLRRGIVTAAALGFAGRLALAEEAKRKNYIQIGRLQLETIDPEDTPTPDEYEDPLNTGTPLIKVPAGKLDANVTGNFKLREYAIIPTPKYLAGTGVATQEHDGRLYHQFIRLSNRLVGEVQTLRDALGYPVSINSPYRNVTYNSRCKGAPLSRHKCGEAGDLTSKGRVAQLYKLADKQLPNGGVGHYPEKDFVHVDVRSKRWRR